MNVICDGAITPYQLPWIITRLIAIKDFLMISIGEIGGSHPGLPVSRKSSDIQKTTLTTGQKSLRG